MSVLRKAEREMTRFRSTVLVDDGQRAGRPLYESRAARLHSGVSVSAIYSFSGVARLGAGTFSELSLLVGLRVADSSFLRL